jgi:hypothetical protein
MARSSSAEFKLRQQRKVLSGAATARLKTSEGQTTRRKKGRGSLDISDLAQLKPAAPKVNRPLLQQSKFMAKEGCADPALQVALQSLTVKYFQELRNLRLTNKSCVNTVISFLSLLSTIDSTVSVSPSFQVTESMAQSTLHAYCGQPGNVVHSLRKFSRSLMSTPVDSIRRAKERLQRVQEKLLTPSLTLMLQFIQTAVNYWESLHSPPSESESVRQSNHIRQRTPNFESSFADVSFIKPAEEASIHDFSCFSILRDQSSITHAPDNPMNESALTAHGAFRAFLTSKLKCLKLASRVIPIKAQALTKAVGSKSAWYKEFLEESERDPQEVTELFSDARFKAEVLKVASLFLE